MTGAQEKAIQWLKIFLEDEDEVDDILWENYIVAGLEEHLTRSEFDVLLPQAQAALIGGTPLPDMDPDIRHAFAEYLGESNLRTVQASELANANSEEDAEAVIEAYETLIAPLKTI